MRKILRNLLLTLSVVLIPVLAVPIPAFAACPGVNDNSSQDQILKGAGQTDKECSEGGVKKIIEVAVTVLSFIAGIAAIIMIIISGLKYTTSSGDSAKISSAKSTLIYALVGLVVAALAQFFVHFVLTNSEDATTPDCAYNKALQQNYKADDPKCVAP